MNLAAADVVREMGGQFNPDAMVRQASQSLDEAARELLMFGGDLWPYGEESPPPLSYADNIIPFAKRSARSALTRTRAAAGAVARSVVVIAGILVLAAATTDKVNLPGMPAVAAYIYSKNPDPQLVRYVEHKGKFMRVEARRVPGEPFDVLHITDIRPSEEAVALDLVADPFETDTTVAGGDVPGFDGKGRRLAPDALTANQS
ncbi:hypothetical protein [Methylobacterium sp. AMS5]|uniref:hypothetical protein n=1 Tax=Methylobacterium sp. AMS5 TaxID=925818 RepID=UPI00118737A3|nr:hypothetical protein [Methylobacterium sp. AMS5]